MKKRHVIIALAFIPIAIFARNEFIRERQIERDIDRGIGWKDALKFSRCKQIENSNQYQCDSGIITKD
jgi:hypothetical protein